MCFNIPESTCTLVIDDIIQKTKHDAQEWLKNLSIGKDDNIDEYRQ